VASRKKEHVEHYAAYKTLFDAKNNDFKRKQNKRNATRKKSKNKNQKLRQK